MIETVFVDPQAKEDVVTQRVLRHFRADQIRFESPDLNHRGDLSAEQIAASKKTLLLTRYKGQFFKRCPGATQKKALTCCNYFILNLGQQCDMDCSYCYLQSYLNSPFLKIYTNGGDAIQELEDMAKKFPEAPYRVGTGEVIDSLSLDPLTLYSRDLIAFAKRFPKWTIEFKTKSDKVDQFLDCDHSGNVVVSWSINPDFIIRSEEHKTASLSERLAAAEKCVAKGFKIAFHIDPMIWHADWKENYAGLIDELTTRFSADAIHVVSVGTLRFQAKQRHIMRSRFGGSSLVVQSEMHLSEQGKMRYDSEQRAEMTGFVIRYLRQKNSQWKSFICMETPENWIKSYDTLPVKNSEIRSFFKPLPVPGTF